MNIVLYESGIRGIPQFLECCFKQIRMFNPDIPIYLLINKENIDNDLFKKYNITSIDKDLYKGNGLPNLRYTSKINLLCRLYGKNPENFWMITTTRLVYIENFIVAHNLKDVYYFENDVLLYYNLQEYNEIFQKLFEHLAITTAGRIWSMTGFFYIKDGVSISLMTQFFIDMLIKFNRVGLARRFGWYKPHHCVNEMKLIKLYGQLKGSQYLSNLPILPFGEYSENFNSFNSIFDSNALGAYVGGVPKSEKPGYLLTHLYVGELLWKNPSYTVVWEKDELQRNIPYFKYDNNEVKINNLHITSKILQPYMS